MAIARSRITAQGRISIPMEVRRKLGVGPGSIVEWGEEGDQIVVRRADYFSSADIHRAVFPEGTARVRTVDDMKEGIRRRTRARYAARSLPT